MKQFAQLDEEQLLGGLRLVDGYNRRIYFRQPVLSIFQINAMTGKIENQLIKVAVFNKFLDFVLDSLWRHLFSFIGNGLDQFKRKPLGQGPGFHSMHPFQTACSSGRLWAL